MTGRNVRGTTAWAKAVLASTWSLLSGGSVLAAAGAASEASTAGDSAVTPDATTAATAATSRSMIGAALHAVGLARVSLWQVVLVSIPLSLMGLLYAVQTRLIYPANFPPGSREHVDTPAELGLPYEDVELRTRDGLRLHAYYIRPSVEDDADEEEKRPTVLYFHANAGNMGHRLPIAFNLYHRLKANVFMLSYRGYGKSEGEPHEKGMRIDAQTALDFLLRHPAAKGADLYVYGQSIGGAVAIDTVARNDQHIAALMVENTFLSIPELIPSVMPFLKPFTFLCHQVWPSRTSMATIRKDLPILFLSSGHDELIPQAHMRELHRIACERHGDEDTKAVEPVRVWHEFPDGTHNDAPMQDGYFEVIERFVKRVRAASAAARSSPSPSPSKL
ncbi:bem46 protein, variant [Blastocladiella emersonii ATCC 22665]|nr:bem46 protein, variant [Blastocladiella emersonii ATCC 22665]